MKQKNNILSTKNLSIGYPSKKGDTVITKAINISLEKGELIGVIGINGSGKSTLLRSLSGLQPVLSGEVLVNNKSVFELSPKTIAKHISLVLTEQGVSKNLSVAELVSLGRQPYTNWVGKLSETDKTAIKNAMQLVDIENLINKTCFELSDGQLQKVFIARALAQDTKLVILDEPTTHLDLHHKAYVLQLLKKLSKDTEKTILFATHEINMALSICDKLIVFQNGTVHFDSPESLFNNTILEDVFPKELIRFDANSKQFVMTKE